jgi:hypothetical protein
MTPGEVDTSDNGAAPMTPAMPVSAAGAPDLTTTIGQPAPELISGVTSALPVTVANTGTGPTTGPITTTMTLPAGVSAPASFMSNGNACTTSGQTVTCVDAGPIAISSSTVISVPVVPGPSTVGTQPVFNATTSTPADSSPANNAAPPLTPASPVAVPPAGDDDADGVPNSVECPGGVNCPDTDRDGAPDHKDGDSDGDGIPAYLDPNDADGVPGPGDAEAMASMTRPNARPPRNSRGGVRFFQGFWARRRGWLAAMIPYNIRDYV